MSHGTPKVLFLSEDVADLAKMAEALLRSLAGDRFEVYSAVIGEASLSPITLKLIKDIDSNLNLDLVELNDYEEIQFDYVITICDQVTPLCTEFPRDVQIEHWQVENPLSRAQPEETMRQARDALGARIQAWLASQ